MTSAQTMYDIWLNRLEPIESAQILAQEIDPRVRVDTFLYSPGRLNITFSDGSKVEVFQNGTRIKVTK